ncbi:glycogen synthase GlgA [Alteromonas oceanisediminis]|uniref:glycogen synthase GlgA n=1 Tax=Alteromonas oceanisediminis TaxID=2836180 RepID=UPI001BD94960|nr:glycogen synthase GlgA [Alteromonas oceanisediminis]MBT0586895.1 glycogen synthase GlgA [Alteromonas oceanisediminis]
MRVAFAVSEVEDLVKTGGLADVGKCLPIALKSLDVDVRIIMPLYKSIADTHPLVDACPAQSFRYGTTRYTFQVKQLELHGVIVYFIDCPDYFHREGIYSDGYEAFADNGQRFAFFALSVLHALSNIGFIPDILHCNDWHTALIPFFMRSTTCAEIIDEFAATRSILTIHNAAFQGVYAYRDVPILAEHSGHLPCGENDYANYLQAGLASCDFVTTVSPNYASELLTNLGSHGLSALLSKRPSKLRGILNGCDYSQWDPSTDNHIQHHYSVDSMAGKASCKTALQQRANLPIAEKTPLIGMVCRLTEQKGFGYILPILKRLLQHNVQLVIVGTGDPSVVQQLSELSSLYSTKFAFIQGFSNQDAHWVEAGSDFFLMPSQFEPCGLNQMYSLAYGTLPIVRGVGGLKDTVVDVEAEPHRATGFMFEAPQPEALLHCIRRALLCYHESPETFAALQQTAMRTRFTWQQAAADYRALYESLSRETV